MKKLDTGIADIYVVPIPIDAYNLEIYDRETLPVALFYVQDDEELKIPFPHVRPLENAKWEILGTITKDSIDIDTALYFGDEEDEYTNYINGQYFGDYVNGDSNLRELISRTGYLFENIYGVYNDYRSDVTPEVYYAAQEKVVEGLAILKKLK